MKRTLIISFIIFTSFFQNVDAKQRKKISINIFLEPVVNTSPVVLGDIAAIGGTDSSLIKKISQIKIISRMPRDITKGITIKKTNITARLRQHGIKSELFELSCPQILTISRDYSLLDIKKVKTLIENFLYKELVLDKSYIRITGFKVKKTALPPGTVTLTVAPAHTIVSYKGKTTMGVNIYVNSSFIKKVRATLFIEQMKDVVLSKKQLKKGEIITVYDLVYKKMVIQKGRNNFFFDRDYLVGKVIMRDLDSGIALKKSDVKDFFPIKKGKKVVILAESPLIKISAQGIAKEKGKKGDRIAVVNVSSKKVIIAKVIDSDTVQIDF